MPSNPNSAPISHTRFKAPLTTAQLKAIQERNPESKDTLQLLSEIKRLRASVLRADQLQRTISAGGSASKIILDCLRAELENEPVLQDAAKLDLGTEKPLIMSDPPKA